VWVWVWVWVWVCGRGCGCRCVGVLCTSARASHAQVCVRAGACLATCPAAATCWQEHLQAPWKEQQIAWCFCCLLRSCRPPLAFGLLGFVGAEFANIWHAFWRGAAKICCAGLSARGVRTRPAFQHVAFSMVAFSMVPASFWQHGCRHDCVCASLVAKGSCAPGALPAARHWPAGR